MLTTIECVVIGLVAYSLTSCLLPHVNHVH